MKVDPEKFNAMIDSIRQSINSAIEQTNNRKALEAVYYALAEADWQVRNADTHFSVNKAISILQKIAEE